MKFLNCAQYQGLHENYETLWAKKMKGMYNVNEIFATLVFVETIFKKGMNRDQKSIHQSEMFNTLKVDRFKEIFIRFSFL